MKTIPLIQRVSIIKRLITPRRFVQSYTVLQEHNDEIEVIEKKTRLERAIEDCKGRFFSYKALHLFATFLQFDPIMKTRRETVYSIQVLEPCQTHQIKL